MRAFVTLMSGNFRTTQVWIYLNTRIIPEEVELRETNMVTKKEKHKTKTKDHAIYQVSQFHRPKHHGKKRFMTSHHH